MVDLKKKFGVPRGIPADKLARARAAGARVDAIQQAEEQSVGGPAATAPAAAPLLSAPSAAPAGGGAPAPAAAPEFGSSQTAAGWQIGQVCEVPHEATRPNPVNPRWFYTASDVDRLAKSLRECGQTTPATGYVEDGFVVLIEGHTRQKACQALGWPTMRIEIREKPASLRQLYEQARAANDDRSNPTNLDEAMRWRRLLDEGVYASQRALAVAVGVHESDVSRILGIGKMPESLLRLLAESPLRAARSIAAVRAFWEACGEDATRSLIQESMEHDLTFADIDSRRKKLLAGPTRRPPSVKRPVQFRGKSGQIKTFEDGRLQLLLSDLSADEADELERLLTQVLAS